MDGGHQQRGGYAFAADIAHGDHHLLRPIGKKIVIIAAYNARRTANAMQLKRAGPNICPRKKLCLHFMRDLQFALQTLFFFLLGDQLLQVFRHGVEGNLQRGQLVFCTARQCDG